MFNSNLANGNYLALATTLNTLNYTTALIQSACRLFRAGVQGTVMRVNRFPENFIVDESAVRDVNFITNNVSNNYHSLQRCRSRCGPARGVSMQSTYTWSKNLGISGLIGGRSGTTFTNPLDRHADYAVLPDTRVHDFRTNGTFALPFGPGKLLLGNSSGGWRELSKAGRRARS